MGLLQSIPEKLLEYLNRLQTVNPGTPLQEIHRAVDEHRLSAYGSIDEDLEVGEIGPTEAIKQKEEWDKRHGYL